jgi:two-component system response regulator YesN
VCGQAIADEARPEIRRSVLFKSHTGRSFSEYLTENAHPPRQAASRQANGPQLKIYDIAEQCGYRDTKYFHRIFKKTVGVSPEAYRHRALGSQRP